MKLNLDGVTCTDIDECKEKTDGCSDVCNNFCGGYACSCFEGRLMSEDQHTCHDPPKDCVGSWSDFSKCSTTCGCGLKRKEFIVTQPAFRGGKECEFEHLSVEVEPCTNKPCPKEYETTEWEYEPCSAECEGSHKRTREIVQVANYWGARKPVLEEVVPCGPVHCPINCIVSEWKKTACNATCGEGFVRHYRDVLQAPMHNGTGCGEIERLEPCMMETCPVNLKLRANTSCVGTGLNGTLIEGLGGPVAGNRESCRQVDTSESVTNSLASCAFECDEIEECAAFNWHEETGICCFSSEVIAYDLEDGVDCFEALSPDAALKGEEEDSDGSSLQFWSIVAALIVVGAAAAAPSFLDKQGGISAPPTMEGASGSMAPPEGPEADPMTSTPMPARR